MSAMDSRPTDGRLEPDAVFESLDRRRNRLGIQWLASRPVGEHVPLSKLAREVAARDHGMHPEDVDVAIVDAVYVMLHHTLLRWQRHGIVGVRGIESPLDQPVVEVTERTHALARVLNDVRASTGGDA